MIAIIVYAICSEVKLKILVIMLKAEVVMIEFVVEHIAITFVRSYRVFTRLVNCTAMSIFIALVNINAAFLLFFVTFVIAWPMKHLCTER